MQSVFPDVDRSKDGKVKSTYPAWYHQQQIDELRESVAHKQYQLDNRLVPPTEENLTRERLKQEKDRLTKIENSSPKLSGPEMDELVVIRKSLGAKIAESMFTRSDMEKGLADAHEEARRMTNPCIKLDDREIKFTKCCDVPISNDGRLSRNAASKVWKLASRLIGEPSNVEALRKG